MIQKRSTNILSTKLIASLSEEIKIHYQQLDPKSNPVTFKKSKKAKYIRISINSDLKVKVTSPYKNNIKQAKEFFNNKIIWVQNSLNKMQIKQAVVKNKSSNIKTNITSEEFLSKNQYLINKCQELAKKHQFKIGKITLRRQKRIWGSCSHQNNISLNSNLAFLDYDLIDYVIYHELVHTEVKNHSKRFWSRLEEVLPGAKSLDKKLRNYQPNFFNN